mmetsp:Transcript_108578/g.198001  ORF Transcript_108578/g.198001 Transcript_108578/m.198001 type:complete len:344 (+) Transcript_108578:59-1090(+)
MDPNGFLQQYNASLEARIQEIQKNMDEEDGDEGRDRSRSPRRTGVVPDGTIPGTTLVPTMPTMPTMPGDATATAAQSSAAIGGHAVMPAVMPGMQAMPGTQAMPGMQAMPGCMGMMPMGTMGDMSGMRAPMPMGVCMVPMGSMGSMGCMMPMGAMGGQAMMMPMGGMMPGMNGMMMGMPQMAAPMGAMNPMMVGMEAPQGSEQEQAQQEKAISNAMRVIKAGAGKSVELDDSRPATLPPTNPQSLAYRPSNTEFVPGVTDRRHEGKLRLFIDGAGYGYGFITCPALKKRYPDKDIFLHAHQKGPFQQGDDVTFNVFVNFRGNPQATDLRRLKKKAPGEAADDD